MSGVVGALRLSASLLTLGVAGYLIVHPEVDVKCRVDNLEKSLSCDAFQHRGWFRSKACFNVNVACEVGQAMIAHACVDVDRDNEAAFAIPLASFASFPTCGRAVSATAYNIAVTRP